MSSRYHAGFRSRASFSLVLTTGLLLSLFTVGIYADSPTATGAEQAQTQITDLLNLQAAAWSRGDLETFVSVYAEEAGFLSTTGLTEGRQKVLERYRKRYPDRAAMGTLTLDLLDFQGFQNDNGQVVGASVIARWTLTYPEGYERETASGLTLLTFRPRAGAGFEIIHDASM